MALHPLEGRRGDTDRDSRPLGLGQPAKDTGTGYVPGLDLVASETPTVLDHRIEGTAEPALELDQRVEDVLGADVHLPVGQGQPVAVVGPELRPRPVEGLFRIEDRPVEVEDEAGPVHRPDHGRQDGSPASAMLSGMFDDLLHANRRYVSGFELSGIPARAAKEFALVTCMDSRIEPLTMLGLRPGDAKILRNAGGRVTPDVLRSLVLATRFLGVRRIAVMQHTECALADTSDDDIRSELAALGLERPDGWEFLAMPDPDSALRSDVAAVRSCGLLPGEVRVEGWRYRVDTGEIVRVVAG